MSVDEKMGYTIESHGDGDLKYDHRDFFSFYETFGVEAPSIRSGRSADRGGDDMPYM